MNTFWQISEKYRGTVVEKVFSSLDQTFSVPGKEVSRDHMSRVIRVNIDDNFYFVKMYSRGGKCLRRFVGRSRVRGEWENLLYFSQIGIPTADIVAYGQESKWGMFKRGALITEALGNTTDMAALARNKSPLLKDRNWIMQVNRQIADFTKRLHDSGFVHYDLRWRNILVTHGINPQVFFIDCPVGRRWFGPPLRRGIIKDLGYLDKDAKIQLSCTARLWFYKAYRGCDKLSKSDKRLIRRVLAIYFGRI